MPEHDEGFGARLGAELAGLERRLIEDHGREVERLRCRLAELERRHGQVCTSEPIAIEQPPSPAWASCTDPPAPPEVVAPGLLHMPSVSGSECSLESAPGNPRARQRSSLGSSSCSVFPEFEALPVWRAEPKKAARRRANSVCFLIPDRSYGEVSQPSMVHSEESYIHRVMMQPSSVKHLCWSCCGLLFILFDVVVIPLAFFTPGETEFMTSIWWFIRIFWTLDIGRTFVTGRFGSNGELEMRFTHVAWLYVRSWRLPVDVLTVVCDWVTVFTSTSGATLTSLWVLRIVRVVRLLRVAKLSEIEAFLAEYIHTESGALIVHILKIILVMLVTAHLIACIWYKVGLSDESADSHAGWVVSFGLQDAPFGDRYAWSLHWSLGQFTGENIFAPQNSTERGCAMSVLLLTFVLSALFVSSITTSMTRLTIVAGNQTLQMVALRRYLFDHRITTSLMVRMQRNAQQALQERKKAPPELLTLVSEPLLEEFHDELHSPVLLHHPLLRSCDEIDRLCVRRLCHTAVSTVSLMRGDVVFRENETPARPRVLFVAGVGQLKYQVSGEMPETLTGGHWACEAVLWTTWVHCGTLVAEVQCKVLTLDAEGFRQVMSAVPTRHVVKYAAAFVEQLNRVDRSELSDLWTPHFEVMELDLPVPRRSPPARSKQRRRTAYGLSAHPGMLLMRRTSSNGIDGKTAESKCPSIHSSRPSTESHEAGHTAG